MEEAATAAAVTGAATEEDTRVRLFQAVIPEADFMEAAPAAGMADTLTAASIMEDIITAATAATITEGLRQKGLYSELFWAE
jgi:hypothetical protein